MPFSPSQADPKNPGTFMEDINHLGEPCWSGITPDIRGGDVVQVLTSATTGDQTPTSGVTVTQKATKDPIDPTVVTVKGSAADPAAPGGRTPIDQLQARIVANKQALVNGGTRTLRAGSFAAPRLEGTIAYDSSIATTWTATFPNLGGVGGAVGDVMSDADRAVGAESRGQWLGRNPLAVNENTIYEFPGGLIRPGPAAGCSAPFAKGPSVQMTALTDTGSSQTDGVTSNTLPRFTGATSLATSTSVNLYVDGVVAGIAPVVGGTYSVTGTTALAEGTHTVIAGEVGPSALNPLVPAETLGNAPLPVTIDTVAPVAPGVTAPASPGISTVPSVKGTAEAGSTVSLYTNTACTAPAAGSSSAAAFASTGISISTPVTAGSTTSFFATATDLAGNMSACSTGAASYLQDSVSPIVTTIAPATNALGVSQAGNVNVMFNESVVGVNGITFTLRSGGSLVGSTVSYNNVGGATLQPTATLAGVDEERSVVTRLSWQLSCEVVRIDRVPPGQPLTRLLDRMTVWRDVLHADSADPDAIAFGQKLSRLRGQPCLAGRCAPVLPEPRC